MSRASYSAPGKLVLIGEYAVTDGFPAVVAAVDRRATVTVDDASDLRVRGNDPRWLTVPTNLVDGESDAPPGDQPLLFAVMREVQRRGMPLVRGHLTVSTTAFSADGKKLGLGSSAAAAVAFAAVFCDDTDTIYDIARTAHRAFQGGGSGIDVAASSYGGLLRFHGGRAQPAPALPIGLAVVVAWTGVPAKTQGFVDAYRALPERGRHAAAIDAATTRFLDAAGQGDSGALLRAVHDARTAMHELGRAARIDIVTAEHARIAAIADAAGGAAKPSGAGGGDVAVCFVPAKARAQLERALTAAGLAVVDVAVGAPGVRVDR